MGGWTNIDFLRELERSRVRDLEKIPIGTIVKISGYDTEKERIALITGNDGKNLNVWVQDMVVKRGKPRKKEYFIHSNLCTPTKYTLQQITEKMRMGVGFMELMYPREWAKRQKRKQKVEDFRQKKLFQI